jgi:hypothetical protein
MSVTFGWFRIVFWSRAKPVEIIQELPMHSSLKQHCEAGFSFYETPGIFSP